MEQAPVLHVPFGMAVDHLSFEFKLHDCGRFLHAGDHELFAHTAFFWFKIGGWVVAVDFSDEDFEGLHWNAVTFLELGESAVAEGDTEDVANESGMSEAGA